MEEEEEKNQDLVQKQGRRRIKGRRRRLRKQGRRNKRIMFVRRRGRR